MSQENNKPDHDFALAPPEINSQREEGRRAMSEDGDEGVKSNRQQSVGAMSRQNSMAGASEFSQPEHKRPQRTKTQSFLGANVYKGNDKVCPAGWPMLIMTFVLILGPSFCVLIFTCYGIGGWLGSVFIGIPYFLSILNTLRLVVMVAVTEPGIIPKLKSPEINYNKSHNVFYRKKEELTKDDSKSPGANYFSLKQFRASTEEEDKNEDSQSEVLSFCATCQIIRPPRSFHCGACGVCIELHDHHCPWVGTCVGRRNTRYFVSFLFWTGIHGVFTLTLCGLYFPIKASEEGKGLKFASIVNGEAGKMIFVNLICGIYGLLFAITLLSFGSYTNSLVLQNITSNENLRKKWNAKTKGTNVRSILVDASWCEKFKSYYLEALPQSRIEQYFKLKGKSSENEKKNNQGSVSEFAEEDENFTELDNKAVLKEYGIELQNVEALNNDPVPRTRDENGQELLEGGSLLQRQFQSPALDQENDI